MAVTELTDPQEVEDLFNRVMGRKGGAIYVRNPTPTSQDKLWKGSISNPDNFKHPSPFSEEQLKELDDRTARLMREQYLASESPLGQTEEEYD